MTQIIQCFLGMALWGSVAAIVVLIVRPFIKKISNRIMCLIWLVVLLRFLCPIAIEREIPAAWSDKAPGVIVKAVQVEEEPKTQMEKITSVARPNFKASSHGTVDDIRVYQDLEEVSLEEVSLEEVSLEEVSLEEKILDRTADTKQDIVPSLDLVKKLPTILGGIWLLGMIALITVGGIRYFLIHKSLQEAIFYRKWGGFPIKLTNLSGVPMSFGIFQPGIYVPLNFEEKQSDVNEEDITNRQKDMIVWHEFMHLKRHDPLMKLVVYAMFAIHWWNPLAWICAKCINQDIEMACDEMVLSFIGRKKRGEYAEILFEFATEQNGISLTTSFGEGHAESRIKNALHFRKVPVWITSITLLFAFALSTCLTLKPVIASGKGNQVSGGDTILQVSGGDAKDGGTTSQVGIGDTIEDESTAVFSSIKNQDGPLWKLNGEDFVTAFPMDGERAELKIYSMYGRAYFDLVKNGEIIGHREIMRTYRPNENRWQWKKFTVLSIEEIGFMDINFDQINDLIMIGETEKGKCVYIVESLKGRLPICVDDTDYCSQPDWLSYNMEKQLGSDLTMQNVKDLLMGQDYDGKFETYQDAFFVVVRHEDWNSGYPFPELIYLDDDDIPELVLFQSVYLFKNGRVYYSDAFEDTALYGYFERESVFHSKLYGTDEYFKLDQDLLSFTKLTQDEMEELIEDANKVEKEIGSNRMLYDEWLKKFEKTDDLVEVSTVSSVTDLGSDPSESVYENFKNGFEKVYFNNFDQDLFDGLNFNADKGYTLSEVTDYVYNYFGGQSPRNKMQGDMVYLDCGQDGIPEIALIFENKNAAERYDKSSLVMVFKEKDGKIQFTYGYETEGHAGQILTEKGIVAHSSNGYKYYNTYEMGLLDANAEYQMIYSISADRAEDAKDYFTYSPNDIDKCVIEFQNDDFLVDEFGFYISNCNNISDDELCTVLKRNHPQGISALCGLKLRDYGINKEMLWENTLFRSSYYLNEKAMGITLKNYKKYFDWGK